MEGVICDVCGKERLFSWADTHGVAQCMECGAPYRVYHYDINNKREDKSPALVEPLDDEWMAQMVAMHQATGAKMSAVGMGLSFPGGYDVASKSDIEKASEWFRAQKEAE